MKQVSKLELELSRMEFRKERQEFVSDMIKEFDNLDPSALDTIFEYKSEDQKQQLDDFWQEKKDKDDRGPPKLYWIYKFNNLY